MRNSKAGPFKNVLLLLLLCAIAGMSKVHANNRDTDHLWKQGRERFYKSVEDKTQIDSAMHLFQTIRETDKAREGCAITYLGALIALKAKHASWPLQKLKFVKQGLAMMDKGISISPDDLEALFIRGSTCYHLPFFFWKGDDAQRDFRKIVMMLPSQIDAYDPALMVNAIQFISKHAELDGDDLETIRKLKADLTGE